MADNVKASVSLEEFTKALRDYLIETSLDTSAALNKKAGDVAFFAAKDMPNAVEVIAKIKTDAPRDSGLYNAIATGKTQFGVTKYGAKVKGQGNDALASKIFNARTRSASYSRFLFLKVAGDFGKKTRGKKASSIKNTRIKKAEVDRILNNPKAIFEILGVEDTLLSKLNEAVQNAVIAQAKDMRDYIAKKLAKRARAHSGRKK